MVRTNILGVAWDDECRQGSCAQMLIVLDWRSASDPVLPNQDTCSCLLEDAFREIDDSLVILANSMS